MHVTLSYEIVSFSDDGKYILVKNSFYGPEGGGGVDFYVIGDNIQEGYKISNNMSPGDGSTPEWISPEEYNRNISKLELSLKNKKFKNIKIKINSHKRRDSIEIKNNTKIMEFIKRDKSICYNDIKLQLNNGAIDFYYKNKVVKFFPLKIYADKYEIQAFVIPNNKIIPIIFKCYFDGGYSYLFYGVFYSKENDWNNPMFYEFTQNE